jgi:hypothetical protein
MSLGTSTFGLIIYGGVCPDSRIMLENAFRGTFNKVSSTHMWSEVGIIPFTTKWQTNKKVCHDGTDKDYPNFDIFQDIQSQIDFSTTQLNIMDYKGDVLKSQFMENKIRERQAVTTVIMPHSCNAKILLPQQMCKARFFCHGMWACHLQGV